MGDLLAIPVGDLFTGAMLPGLVLSSLYLAFIMLFALARPDLLPPASASPFNGSGRDIAVLLFKGFVPPTLLVLMVLGSIFFGIATPTEAAGVGAFGAVALSIANRSFSLRLLRDVAEEAALTNAMIFGIFCGAALFSYVFRALGGDDAILHIIAALDLHDWALLGLLMLLIFLLGFFFDWLEITLIILPIFAPIVAALDLGTHVPKSNMLLWFAVMMAINLQTSYLTPPFGPALFYLRGAGSDHLTLRDIYRGIIPFTLLQLTGLAVCIIWPDIILWLPRLLNAN
jgi:tripartite ATP-independent transporter DctM subunit